MLRGVVLRKTISSFGVPKALHALVHASVASRSEEVERHSRFMAANIFAGCAAFSVPFANVLQTSSSSLDGIAIAGVGFPLIAAWMVSRTGDLRRAGYVSLAGFASFLAGFGLLTQSLAAPLAVATAGLGLATVILWQRFAEPRPVAAEIRPGPGSLSLAGDTETLVTTHDSRGATLAVSGVLQDAFGLRTETGRRNGLANRIHLQDRIPFLKAISDAAHGAAVPALECRARDAEGLWHRVEIEFSSAPLCHDGAVSCTLRELTPPNAKSILQPADGAHDSQRFIMTMSHELRTPLNAIAGFTDVLKREIFGKLETEKQREYVGLIQDSASHMLSVVNTMLDYLRLDDGKYAVSLKPVDFEDVASPAMNMLSDVAADAGVDLTCEVAVGLPTLKADASALQQVLVNLLSNAIKFTPRGGAVRLTARRVDDIAVIEVVDSGIGMDSAFLARADKPFVQASRDPELACEGTGLGLSLAKGLLALQHGGLAIESEKGRGTSVAVTLPLHFSSSNPVPSNEEDRLVRLSGLAAAKASRFGEPSKTSPDKYQSKGDRHARRSA